jgi:hypothetical protein
MTSEVKTTTPARAVCIFKVEKKIIPKTRCAICRDDVYFYTAGKSPNMYTNPFLMKITT